MKAQRIRKLLWASNLALAAGTIGVGALLFLDKPAEAKTAPPWVTKALEQYSKNQPRQMLGPAVQADEITKLILKPEWKGLPYYPFAGPRIPAPPEKTAAAAEAPKGPEGLEAIGRVRTLIYNPPLPGEARSAGTTVMWAFSDKESGFFTPGEFVAKRGQAQRFKLIDVVRLSDSRFELHYEVYDDPKGKPVSTGKMLHDNTVKLDRDVFLEPGVVKPEGTGAPAPAPGAAPVGPRASGGPSAAPTPVGPRTGYTIVGSEGPGSPAASGSGAKDWRPDVTSTSANRRRMEFNENTFAQFKGKNIEQVLENVRTEVYNKGGVQGVQMFPVGDTSVAERFDVRRGDILIAINGQAVKSREDAIRIVRAFPADIANVSVEIDRDGKRIFYDVDPRDPKVRRAAAGLQTR